MKRIETSLQKVRAYRKTAVAKVYGNDSAAKKVKIK